MQDADDSEEENYITNLGDEIDAPDERVNVIKISRISPDT